MKMPTPVTTAIDRTLEVKGAIFHRYHNFKMTMLTCSHTVFNFKGDSRHGISFCLLLKSVYQIYDDHYCDIGMPLCTVSINKHLEPEAVESMWPCSQRVDLNASIPVKTMLTLKRWQLIISKLNILMMYCNSAAELIAIVVIVCKL